MYRRISHTLALFESSHGGGCVIGPNVSGRVEARATIAVPARFRVKWCLNDGELLNLG